MNGIDFIHGANGKPVASQELQNTLSSIENISGVCFFGFPLIATPDGKRSIDATLVSPEKGVILFDLVEGVEIGDYESRQDDIVNKVESKLKLHKDLVHKRKLITPLNVVTFAPALSNSDMTTDEDYPLSNAETLVETLSQFDWNDGNDEIYRKTLSAIESLSSLRKSRSKREVKDSNSRGAKLKRLEDSIATLDHRQNRAVIETVDGVQRIRGLAGSGKTIVLALKAAYLHTQYPDWRIAVTFNTRSLKGQFKRLITNFCIEQSGEEPDWTKLRIVNAWGAPGESNRDGIYYEFCRNTGVKYFDYYAAKREFGSDNAFDGVCTSALSTATKSPKLYDAILVDEAQDFAPSFLRLCYAILDENKRLVYAYDELQNLSGVSVPPPEDIFGRDEKGRPLVSLEDDPRRDVILQVCYRNSRPVLVTAHALGFGIYREPNKEGDPGMVQMFEYPALWTEIGYRVREGTLEKGQRVVLERTNETSPRFLEEHSPVDDLLIFKTFDNENDQIDWILDQIRKNIEEDELRHDDIVVIHPNPLTARKKLGPIRKRLFDMGIQNHMAGVDTDADVFYRTDTPSVVFTSIYRAKGNEAGMVYIVNAQDCEGYGAGLSSLRNRLFTAITRSKAWVRVVGYGPRMKRIEEEFEKLKDKNFLLDFMYPSEELLKHLQIVHRDISPEERKKLENKTRQLSEVVSSLEKGELKPEDLEPSLREKLIELLKGSQ